MNGHVQTGWIRVAAVVAAAAMSVAGMTGRVAAQITNRATEHSVVIPADGVGERYGYSAPGNPVRAEYRQHLFRVPASMPAVVRSVALRRRDTAQSPATYPAFSLDMTVGLGHSPRSPATPSYDLWANRGADFTFVLSRQTVHFPATQRSTDGRYAFDYRFPFDRPFAIRPSSDAVIEFQVYVSAMATSRCRPTRRSSARGSSCKAFVSTSP